MPKKGYKSITVTKATHDRIGKKAKEKDKSIPALLDDTFPEVPPQ
jgi:hypothetical protein